RRGGRGHRPSLARPHFRGFRARLSVALDQHLRPALRHARDQVAQRRGVQRADRAGRLLAGDAASEGPGRRRHNRRIFEDNVELVVKAWTQESFTHNGPAWQVPYPYEAGIEDWPLARAGVTQKLGAPGEVDERGVWRRASVAPAPYTRPHPKVFVAGSGS